jgi:hypothetical protein
MKITECPSEGDTDLASYFGGTRIMFRPRRRNMEPKIIRYFPLPSGPFTILYSLIIPAFNAIYVA